VRIVEDNLKNVQQRVEGLGRELMRLIDDIHLVLPHRGGKADLVA